MYIKDRIKDSVFGHEYQNLSIVLLYQLFPNANNWPFFCDFQEGYCRLKTIQTSSFYRSNISIVGINITAEKVVLQRSAMTTYGV